MTRFLLALLLWASSASAQVATGLWFPTTILSTDGIDSPTWQATDVMNCVDWVPSLSITSATSVTIGTGGAFTATCGIAIYDATGATPIMALSAPCSQAFAHTVFSGLTPFSLTAGTPYRTCWCISPGGGGAYATISGVANMSSIQNAFVTHQGTAANPCVSGVTPATTGTITPADMTPPLMWISKE